MEPSLFPNSLELTMSAKDRIIALLKAGVAPSQIADSVGCDPSYVSQIKNDPEIAPEIAAARLENIEEDLAHDDLLEKAELKALKRIDQAINHANLGQALAAYKVLNAAKKRTDPAAGNANQPNVAVTVSLQLPATLMPHYVKNANNEIIEVEGRTMVTATPKSLDALLAERATNSGVRTNPEAPLLSDLTKAANILEGLETVKAAPRSKPHRLPAVLSPDIL
jgi:hypothetical protein